MHISDDGYGSQFRLAASTESLHFAEYLHYALLEFGSGGAQTICSAC
jgi:hypothetical protein